MTRSNCPDHRLGAIVATCLFAALLLPAPAAESETRGSRIASAASDQVGKTLGYDPSYRKLSYPNGDVPLESGVCTDVVIRALRSSLGFDLQARVHQDMRANFKRYPGNWGLSSPDRNIDHRRVPNLRTYFERRGWSVPSAANGKDYAAGDLVTCTVPPNLPHIMVVSSRKNLFGRPLVIHNIGGGAKEEDRLFEFKHTGHYRVGDVGNSAAD